jgi:hypothetical protein
MNVKSKFLNEYVEEEVYIEQPKEFYLSKKENYVCELKKVLYGLKQSLRLGYSRMDRYLQQQGFMKGNANNNLYIKVNQDSTLLNKVYVDDDRMSQRFYKHT